MLYMSLSIFFQTPSVTLCSIEPKTGKWHHYLDYLILNKIKIRWGVNFLWNSPPGGLIWSSWALLNGTGCILILLVVLYVHSTLITVLFLMQTNINHIFCVNTYLSDCGTNFHVQQNFYYLWPCHFSKSCNWNNFFLLLYFCNIFKLY